MTRTIKDRKEARRRQRRPASKVHTGYVPCGCRDCMELAIGLPGAMCWECAEAGCEPGSECKVERNGE